MKHSPRTLACLIALALASALSPGAAHAFSDPTLFGLPPTEAGGGGRYFTGSPSDGYTCSACHAGAEGPELRVLGLPLRGYTPGRAYEITIDWSAAITHVSLSVELTDELGAGVGTIRLPPESELPSSERCLPETGGMGAGFLQNADLQRTIVSVMDECGARQLRFLWTAPLEDRGPVWFSGAVVRANDDDNVSGDGVTSITHVLSSPSSSAEAAAINGGCSSVGDLPPTATRAGVSLLLLSLAALRFRTRRSRRRQR